MATVTVSGEVVQMERTDRVKGTRFRPDPGVLLESLDALAERERRFIGRSAKVYVRDGRRHEIPRYVFLGPETGGDPIRVALFAGIHGDEPEGVRALVHFLKLLAKRPELAAGYCLFVYPILNPTGYEDRTRESRSGKDLNREFWRDSSEPEVRHVEEELRAHAFHGIVSLHTDDTSEGFYGFAHGRTLTEQLLEPALRAAEQLLPRNRSEVIDGFTAVNGIITDRFEGILSAPPEAAPKPFEIILETPKMAPEFVKESALVLSVQSILAEYRRFIAYAPNL